MSANNNRIGRNPFDKKPKASPQASQSPELLQASKTKTPKKSAQLKKAPKASTPPQTEFVLKTSDRKTEAAEKLEVTQTAEALAQKASEAAMHSPKAGQATAPEEQIIGELIDLPEENWQPLTIVPSHFIKQLLSRWI